MTEINGYPLAWPEMFPRHARRGRSQFKTSLSGALKNVRHSLEAFGRDSGKKVEEIVISSNVTLGNDLPADPGVAVWFKWDGLQVCIPVDRYEKIEDNLQAIYHVIEARRVELRHGTLAIVRATMTGFAALPPQPTTVLRVAPRVRPYPALWPTPGRKPWRDVLKIAGPATSEAIHGAHRALAKTAHPDAGGSAQTMAELNDARDRALREIGAK